MKKLIILIVLISSMTSFAQDWNGIELDDKFIKFEKEEKLSNKEWRKRGYSKIHSIDYESGEEWNNYVKNGKLFKDFKVQLLLRSYPPDFDSTYIVLYDKRGKIVDKLNISYADMEKASTPKIIKNRIIIKKISIDTESEKYEKWEYKITKKGFKLIEKKTIYLNN